MLALRAIPRVVDGTLSGQSLFRFRLWAVLSLVSVSFLAPLTQTRRELADPRVAELRTDTNAENEAISLKNGYASGVQGE